nr:MAG TPA: hypothetical protein [Caudoviricetes sp.]
MRNFASCNTKLSFRLSSHLYSQLNRRYTSHYRRILKPDSQRSTIFRSRAGVGWRARIGIVHIICPVE